MTALIVAAAAGGVIASGAPAMAADTATVVSPRLPLNVRSGPAVWYARVGALPNGSAVTLACQVSGQQISGSVRSTDAWDRLADNTYISDAWVRRSTQPPRCAAGPMPQPTGAVAATFTGNVVASGTPLNVRSGPSASASRVRSVPNGTALTLSCQVTGQRITGSVRTTDAWDRLPDGTFVSDAYVSRTATPPPCGATPAAGYVPAPGAWAHPLPGFSTSSTSFHPPHIGVDFMSYVGTPIRAASAGQVTQVICNIQPGASCDVPGSSSTRGCGWYVKIVHPGGVTTLYCHMVHQPAVAVGQQVAAGQVIGYVGSSGNSSFPHLHFEVHTGGTPTGPANAVDPVVFMRQAGINITRA
jgi:murein DD-endopeptidase MepM/ murein hydrolase activator NlpD